MNLAIRPDLETKIRDRAEAEGLTIEDYLERLVQSDVQADDELQSLALEGLESGAPIDVQPDYWERKHRSLDERLKNPGIS
jgi:hypothetical protein